MITAHVPTPTAADQMLPDRRPQMGRVIPNSVPNEKSALDIQIGGDHYKSMAIQPVEFIHKNGIGFLPGNIIKYVCRYQRKAGVEDLKKARHYLDLLIEMEEK